MRYRGKGLLLDRKVGEVVRIGPDISVMVTRIEHRNGGAKVRLGITAPDGVRIDRAEVAKAIARGEPRKD